MVASSMSTETTALEAAASKRAEFMGEMCEEMKWSRGNPPSDGLVTQ